MQSLNTINLKNLLFVLFIINFNTFGQDYIPPIGIPAPDFGINEQLEDFYTRPNPWNTETAGWYHINQYHTNASNSNTYGTPNNPRVTIPTTIPAGSVVEISGVYDYAPTGYETITCQGTQNAPVFIIGDDTAVVLRKWVVKSSYTIIENMEFTNLGKVVFSYPSYQVSLRDSELHNIPGKVGGGGTSNTERLHHIIIYNNQIHSQNGWNQNPGNDLDNHAIKFGQFTEDIWVLENTGYNNGGNFIQVGDYANPPENTKSRRFYIGKNNIYANRQSGIGIKQSMDVIISENTIYNGRVLQSNAGSQSAVFFQYAPENLWIINNIIYDCDQGIGSGSNSGGDGQNQYIIGNLIYNIHMPSDYNYNVNTAWAPAGIMLAGGQNRYIINNTISNVDAGINIPGGGNATFVNNIISNTTKANHLFIEIGNTANTSFLYNNIIHQENNNAKIRWGNGQIIDVPTFEANYPSLGSGNHENNPDFIDELNNDYNLQANSLAIDNGIVSSVYQTFYNLYGIDIKKDLSGQTRPQNSIWDIGAFEYDSALSTNNENLNNTILIYPNPITNTFTINLKNETLKDIFIYNQLGQQIKGIPITTGTNQVNISNLANGIYFIKITSQSEKTASKKIIKN